MPLPTRVSHCDTRDGQRGALAWRVMYEFVPGKWTPLSIPFDTEDEARAAEISLRREGLPPEAWAQGASLSGYLDQLGDA